MNPDSRAGSSRVSAVGLALIAVVAAIGVTACSDDEQPADTTEASEPAEATLPEPIPIAGAERVDLQDRLVREISIPNAPDWMAEGFGSLWVKRGNGVVDRVDPRTGKVLAEVSPGPFKPPTCNGLGVTDDAVWTCPGRDELVQIDPESDSITKELKSDNIPDQSRLADAAGRLWVITDSGKQLSAIDPETGRPSSELKLPGRCTDLARSEDKAMWVLCPLENRVLKVDHAAGEITDELELGEPRTAAATEEELWVGFEGGIAQIDAETLEVSAVYEIYPRYGGSIFASDDAVWVREEDGHFLTHIDPVKQVVVETIEAPKLPSGGDVLVIEDTVWATAFDDSTLVQVRADGG